METIAAIFLGLVGFAFVQNVARGQGRQWLAAKFLNRGSPPPGAVAAPPTVTGSATRQRPSGTFGDPLPGGRLISGWGAPRDGGARRHEGIDIAAPRGTAVLSAAAGKVVRVSELKRCGLRVAVAHGNNVESIYCHLSAYGVKVGQTVRRGQVLGYVGTSGNARHSTPHLHFEIRRSGQPIPPAPVVGR